MPAIAYWVGAGILGVFGLGYTADKLTDLGKWVALAFIAWLLIPTLTGK